MITHSAQVAVEFRGQLDAALVGGQKEYREWFGNQSAIEGYRRYKDAIEKSAEAAEVAPDEIITLVNPLDKTKSATGLLAMWKAIQEVSFYRARVHCGQSHFIATGLRSVHRNQH